MQLISPSWHCERNTRRGPSHRLKTNLLHFAALLLIALSPRVGWAQEPDPGNTRTFAELKQHLESDDDRDIILKNNVTWNNSYNITVRGTKTLTSTSGEQFTISRTTGNKVSSIVLMDGASLTVTNVTFDGNDDPNCASMILVRRDDDKEIYAAASLTMTNCTMVNCLLNYGMALPSGTSTETYHFISSLSGAAINFSPSTETGNTNLRNIQLKNCVFDNNRVTKLSGPNSAEDINGINALDKLYCNGGAIGIGDAIGAGSHITSCTFTNNKAAQGGGALYFENTLNEVQVIGCTIGTQNNPNTAGTNSNGSYVIPAKGGSGGGIYFAGGKVKFKNTKIEHNLAYYYGGGIYIAQSESIKFVTGDYNNSISNNIVAEITPTDTIALGGGIYVRDDNGIAGVDIQYTNIYSNKAFRGGGIYINGQTHQPAPVFSYCNIGSENIGSENNGNEATANGGGIYLFGSQAKFYNCKIQYNYTAETTKIYHGTGGGIYKSANTTAEDQQVFQGCDISYNGYQGSTTKTKKGGGVYIENTNFGTGNYQPRTTFSQCDIHHNKAIEEGGGLHLNYEGIKLQQNKVYSNESKKGGGIYMQNGKILGGSGANKIYRNTASIDGGGIYYENGTIQGNNYVYVNTATKNGGGLYVNTKGSTATDRTFDHLFVGTDDAFATDMGNRAENGGGIYIKNEQTGITITLDACSIVHNKVQKDSTTINQGGGVYMSDASATKVKLAGGTNIQGNEALDGGGVYINQQGNTLTLNLTNATLSGNKATTGDGGGIYNNKGTVLCESGCSFTFDGNKALAGSGGGIYNMGGTLTLNGTDGMQVFKNNKALAGGGGGIYNNGTATLTNCDIGNNNEAKYGGGINNTGSLTLNNTRVSYNTATQNGGGIFHNSGIALALQGNTTFSGNEAQNNGGGLYNGKDKTTTIESATFNGNKAITNNGGGIYNDGTTTITSATFDGNTAGNDGGGIYNAYGKTTTITTSATFNGNIAGNDGGGINNQGTVDGTNSTVSFVGNQAPTGNGGGIYNLNILDLDGTNTKTFTGNIAKNGGGIYNDKIEKNLLVVPPPPITIRMQKKENGSWGEVTDEPFEGIVRLYFGYQTIGNINNNLDSLVLFYDSSQGGDLGKNILRKRANGTAYPVHLYAAYTPGEYETGYNEDHRLRVITKRIDATEETNFHINTFTSTSTATNTVYDIKVGDSTRQKFPDQYPGGLERLSYAGRLAELNNSKPDPESIDLAGTANLENCLMGGSAANANKATAGQATDGHGGGIYICNDGTANLKNSSITNNEAARFGGGVYICTNGIMGVKGEVTVSGNTSTRTDHNAFSKGSAGAWDDDVCLQTISKQSKDPEVISHLSGKIKVLDDITHSKIGITEEEITEGTTNEGTRREDDHGDYNRQFTIDYYKYHDAATVMALFFSNDNVLDVIPLYEISEGEEYVTTTGKLEVTLGIQPDMAWYVAGIVDDANLRWGDDNNSGLAPDVPCRTLTGPNGIFARGYNPNNHKHHVFVVRSISIKEEALVRTTTINGEDVVVICYPHGDDVDEEDFKDPDYQVPDDPNNTSLEVKLHRYPGGHRLSNGLEDDGGGTVAGSVASGSQKGPGANVGPIVQMNAPNTTILRNIEMDGLSEYDGVHNESHNPATKTFDPTSAVLAVEEYAVEANGTTLSSTATGTITLKEECRVALNNNKDGISDNSGSPDNKREERPGGGVYNAGTLVITGGSTVEENLSASHGGGVYVKKGLVTLEGDGTAVKDNDVTHETNDANGGGVYIDTDGTLTVNGSGTKGVMIQHNTAKTHGGGVYKLGTLNVQGMVTITHNEKETARTENVYIPAAAAEKHILITDELACGSSIGVTKTKYWNGTPDYGDLNGDGSLTTADDGDHTYINDDNFTEVRTVIAKNETDNSGHAWDAYGKDVFFDDKDCYTVWCFEYQNEEGGNYDSETPSATAYQIDNCYFIETWRSYADDGDDHVEVEHQMVTQVKTPQGLAYFAKHVNDGHSYDGASVLQEANINLDGHYWEPIGYEKPQAACDDPIAKPFSGSYDGQGHLIFNAYSILPAEDMGLFGTLTGTVKHTFAIGGELAYTHVAPGSLGAIAGEVSGTIDGCEAAGFKLFGYADNASAGGIAGITSGEVRNSFTSGITYSGNPDKAGGLVGYITSSGAVRNCYSKAALPNVGTTKGILVGTNDGELKNAYTSATSGAIVGDGTAGTNIYAAGTEVYKVGSDEDEGYVPNYTAPIGADHLGYMCIDNGVPYSTCGLTTAQKENLIEGKDYFEFHDGNGNVTLIPLFRLLNLNAKALNNSNNYTPYAEWARPALAFYEGLGESASTTGSINSPINGDLPLLMLNNYDGSTHIGQGGFRSVGTYGGGGDVLQYGGPDRDGNELDAALTRPKVTGFTGNDYLFVYGDVNVAPAAELNTFTQAKVSIYEHAAISRAGTLAGFTQTYVGVTFDNSAKNNGSATNGINYIDNGPSLPRNWHMLSTPVSNAPLGFYYPGEQNSNKYTSGNYSNANFFNNPWGDVEGSNDPNDPSANEFSWLNGGSAGHNRYWMYGWDNSRVAETHDASSYPATTWQDGYFPSKVNTSAIQFGAQLFIPFGNNNGSNEYVSGNHRYPYGMDLYSWYEPGYHYINFKRNGPNHWHSDPPHVHLDYTPEEASNNSNVFGTNVNETTLLDGKGYMASIHIPTFLQSSGLLGGSTKTIKVTYNENVLDLCEGWNLVGNPFHAYLDFDEFITDNSDKPVDNIYVVYNSDGFGSAVNQAGNMSGHYGNGFSYYVQGASREGAYANRYLHPHQGFFVKVNEYEENTPTPTLTFKESHTTLRSDLTANDGSYRDDSRPAYPLVNLFLTSDKGCSDVCVVEFNRPEWGGATKLRDMYSGNGLFYAAHDNGNYAALFATPEAERIPLKFEAKDEAGDTYTIHWNTQNGDFRKLYLVDNITGVQYDMLRNSSYSFSGKKDDYWTRFYITFEVTGLEEEQDDEDDDDSTGSASTTFAFFDGSQWVVTNDGHGTATLDLIDLQGRVLHSTTLAEGQARIGLPDVAKGMYLMRMTNQNGMFVQKIVVR